MAEHEEDPGTCPYCGTTFQIVRPGKSQPTCDCQDEVVMTKHQQRLHQQETDLLRAGLESVRILAVNDFDDAPFNRSTVLTLADSMCRAAENVRRKRGA